MPAASSEMIQLVGDLLDDQDLRVEFHEAPTKVMDDYELTSFEERAVLFSMRRDRIAERAEALREEIEAYQMSSDWPEQGVDWRPGEPESADPPDGTWRPVDASEQGPCSSTLPLFAADGGAATRGGWSDPQPHGRGFRPHKVSLADGGKVELTLVGEGYLGSARVYIAAKNGSGAPLAPPAKVEQICVVNFRRVYIRTTIDISGLAPGHYSVRVQNFAHPDVPAIRAGHLLEITA